MTDEHIENLVELDDFSNGNTFMILNVSSIALSFSIANPANPDELNGLPIFLNSLYLTGFANKPPIIGINRKSSVCALGLQVI
ncbi:MAG: hypothetical protein AAFV80_09220 [Bacteroidota bacterium]